MPRMPQATLAGLPRLVRVAEEVRVRGLTFCALAGAVIVYGVLAWLVDEPVSPAVSGLSMLAVFVIVGLGAMLVSRRRVRDGLAAASRPPRNSVYETRADARERRTRLTGFLALAVVVLLIFDRLSGGEGRMAGLVAGLALAVGLVDWVEAHAWHRAERSRGSRLYVLVRAAALMSPFGVTEVYEVVRPDDRERDPADVDAPYVM